MKAVAEARNLALEGAKLSRFDERKTTDAVAGAINSTRLKDEKIRNALKSVKLVPLSEDEGAPEQEGVPRWPRSGKSFAFFTATEALSASTTDC